jgi:hypothetical protein
MYGFFCSFLVTMFIVLLGLSDHYVLVWVVVVVVEQLAKPGLSTLGHEGRNGECARRQMARRTYNAERTESARAAVGAP